MSDDYKLEYCNTCVSLSREVTKEGVLYTYHWCNRNGCWRKPEGSACALYVRDPQCFLTTACVEYKGLPDDCEELTKLRVFRDTYMKKSEEGRALVDEYYQVAPGIVRKINERTDKEEIYNEIYRSILACIDLIDKKEYEQTCLVYSEMVQKIKSMVE